MKLKLEISSHLDNTFMPYAMTTILDRALPDVRDGLKPVHRRILYAMENKSIVYNKSRVKSSEPVSETMKIHGHGDSSIYEALALMTEQNETLLHPFIDGEGAFGKAYNRDSPSAQRYTYCRLNKFSMEMFKDITKDVVDFVEEGGHKQPLVLPNTFPNILIKPNNGVAVGVACNFPSFNLSEICETAIAYIKDENISFEDFIKAPDFSTGGKYVYDKNELMKVIETGRGAFKIRSKYNYVEKENCIEVYEIPYSTTVEAIIDKVTQIIKSQKMKDILDIRDETGWCNEENREKLKLTIEIKKKADVELIMSFLFKNTPLESSFPVNMNCISDNSPKVLGVKSILNKWIAFRKECIKKALQYDLDKYRQEYKLLKGLSVIANDIDSAIAIIRKSKTDKEVISSLINHFGIEETQANYIADIKLRNLNKEFIGKKISRLEEVEKIGKKISTTLSNEDLINDIIIKQLEEIKSTYGQERKTEVIQPTEIIKVNKDDLIEDYNCQIILTKENYLKKTLRYSDTQKVKEGDKVMQQLPSTNKSDILMFTNLGNVYSIKSHTLGSTQPSNLGIYIPTLISLESEERVIYITTTVDYKGDMIFGFKNGKVAKVSLSSYQSSRVKLANSYNINSELVCVDHIVEECNYMCVSSIDKMVIFNTEKINSKTSRTTQGVNILKSKNDSFMSIMKQVDCELLGEEISSYYRASTIPAIGTYIKKEHKDVFNEEI